MSTTLLLTIIVTMFGVITALIGLVYKIQSNRIQTLEKEFSKIHSSISSILTDLSWIKDKLKKL